jgi:Gpi18-like mannosyltransferase
VADPSNQQNNLAFFPLYPTLIRAVTSLIPGTLQTQEILLAGVLISNLCLLGAMLILYPLSMDLFSDQKIAEKSILYMLFFPAGFFLSAAYTESLFLFCVLLAFFAGQRRIWPLAGIAGFFAALTRSPGIFLFPALLWLYMEQKNWKFKQIDFRILFLALIPTGLLLVLWIGYNTTGDWLAPLNAQAAWQRELTWPWVTLFAPPDISRPHFNQIEWVSLVLFIALSIFALIRLPS